MEEGTTFDWIFEHRGIGLPVAAEQVGVVSIDTLNRNWVHVHTVPADHRMTAISKDGLSVITGLMRKRADGKDCLVIEARWMIENGDLVGQEYWHSQKNPALYESAKAVLREQGLLG